MMNIPGNIIWLICGGLLTALGYAVAGVVFCATIIGIPFGLQCFKIAGFELWPFGKTVVTSNRSDGCLHLVFNLLWICTGGLYTALVHLFFAFILFITVIGIPFARKHLELAGLSLAPFGKDIVYA